MLGCVDTKAIKMEQSTVAVAVAEPNSICLEYISEGLGPWLTSTAQHLPKPQKGLGVWSAVRTGLESINVRLHHSSGVMYIFLNTPPRRTGAWLKGRLSMYKALGSMPSITWKRRMFNMAHTRQLCHRAARGSILGVSTSLLRSRLERLASELGTPQAPS